MDGRGFRREAPIGRVRHRAHLSLLGKLALTIGGLLLLVIGTLVSAAYLSVDRSARARANDRLERSVTEISGLLHATIQRLMPDVRARAEDPAIMRFLSLRDPADRAAALDALRYDGPRPELVVAIELLDSDGDRLLASGPHAGETPRLSPAYRGGHDSARAGRIVALRDSAVFPILATVVVADGRRLGTVVTWWRLDITLELNGARSYVGNPVDGTWTDLHTFVPAPVPELDADAGVLWHTRGDSSWIAASSNVSRTPWSLIVEIPQSDVLAPVQLFLKRVAILGILLFCLSMLAIWHLSRRITAPLRSLTAAAGRISAGDYSARVTDAGEDELGRLSAAFNGMSQRVQTAHRLVEEQAAQYRMLFDCNPSPMWVFDRDTMAFIAVNEAACAHYGYSRDEFVRMTIVDIRPETEIPRLRHDLEQGHQGLDTGGVWLHRKKNGDVIAVEITSHDITFAGRAAVLVLAQDVTQRHQAQESLRSAHEQLRAIVEAAPVAIYSLDAQACVRSWNPAAEQIFGYSSDEVIGKRLPMVPSGAEAETAEWLGQVMSGCSMVGVEVDRVRKDGTRLSMRVYAGPIHDAEGSISGAMVAATDVTEVRRLEQQYRQAQKMEAVGRLAGGVAHDFNNLLTVILGETDLAMDEIGDNDVVRPSLEEITRAGRAAAELTRRLLAFSRQQIVEATVFSLNDLVAGIEKMLRRLIGEDVRLVTRLATDTGNVRADYSQFEQLLLNLAVNARDAMPEGGVITIETCAVTFSGRDGHGGDVRPGEYVRLSVTDSGTGMSEETRARIFEPFFTTKGPGKGTGLGLAMCYGIAKQAGGHIEVISEPGCGATFNVYIPRVPHAPSDCAGTGLTRDASGQERILLVEDQPAVRQVTARMLESLGYHVVTAADAEEALRIIQNGDEHLDLLLTDVVLPGMKGAALGERATAIRPELKVVFASGYTSDIAGYQKLIEDNAVLIQKPFTAAHLGERIRTVLDVR